MKTKYIWLLLICLTIVACNDPEDFIDPVVIEAPLPPLTAGSADFSKFVAVGSSFTAGMSDGALFRAAQENSFPNIMASQFAKTGGGAFTQPLMSDNTGGLLMGGTQIVGNRLVFDGSGPAPLESVIGPVTPTTDILVNNPSGPFNNMGVPVAKSFHLLANGYGNAAGVPAGLANPFFARMASSPTASVFEDVLAQQASFFSLSIGSSDVLAYAMSGGDGVNQAGNFDPSTYGGNDITDPNVFAQVFNGLVTGLTANGAKGVVGNIPYIESLPYFTTIPYAPLSPANPAFGPQIPTLNALFGQLNQIFEAYGETNRLIVFSETEASPVIIKDESLSNMALQIIGALNGSPTFPAFVQSFGLEPEDAPLVAFYLGATYGQARQATENDLLVLPSLPVIGSVNTDQMAYLMSQGLPPALAGQFSAEGVLLPLADKWVLTSDEQEDIKTATDAFNSTIESIAGANGLAFVDLKDILMEASTTGIDFDEFTTTADLVTGGLVSLDGVHLTARGYALMANKFLEAIDATYGSNFAASGNLAKAAEYNVAYFPGL